MSRRIWLALLLAVALITSTIFGFAAPAEQEGAFTSGIANMPSDVKMPTQWMPDGAFDEDSGPSTVIFPPQSLTIRFNHKYHVQDQKRTCRSCHTAAVTSNSVQDKLTPPGTVCDACHLSDHTNLSKVEAGDDNSGQCRFCHIGYKPENKNEVPRFFIPRANMVFSHGKHSARNIACGQCHGEVQQIELATRDQMPRMRGCFKCHQMSDASSRGDAKGACDTCHIQATRGEGGTIKTMFQSGVMKPPRWLKNADHGPDFILRHKTIAANDSTFCATCHQEDYCTACHDGRTRPRSVHPSDYLNMHPIEARMVATKCTSCHREQSFCITCHERVGVSMSGPAAVRESTRFHPPRAVWSDAGGWVQHGAEAKRNLNACVACHNERDCTTCHGTRGVGAGFSPHKSGFANTCGIAMSRNPRPCFVCHDPNDTNLAVCR